MYRRYENPYKLQEQLDELRQRYCDTDDEDERAAMQYDIAELEDRIRFAWDDDENG